MKYKIYGESNIGLVRKSNQDSICIMEGKDNAFLTLVCDGIGGGNAGEVASKIATDHLGKCFLTMPILKSDIEVKHWLEDIIKDANDLVFKQASTNIDQKGMGTTVVGVLRCSNRSYVFNVGDSRAYALYNDILVCLTEDHTFVADLLKRGEVSAEEARMHPNRNVLTNALGIWDQVKVDVCKIKEGYAFLLICSDGLHGYVKDNILENALKKQGSAQDKVKSLISIALKQGGLDNVSVILVDCEGDNDV